VLWAVREDITFLEDEPEMFNDETRIATEKAEAGLHMLLLDEYDTLFNDVTRDIDTDDESVFEHRTEDEVWAIVRGKAGSFMEPPGHISHRYSVTSYGVYGGDSYGSVTNALDNEWTPEPVKEFLRGLMERENKPVCDELWLRKTYLYFKHCFSPDGEDRNVSDCIIDSSGIGRADWHLGYMYVKARFPEHEPRVDLIHPPVDKDMVNAHVWKAMRQLDSEVKKLGKIAVAWLQSDYALSDECKKLRAEIKLINAHLPGGDIYNTSKTWLIRTSSQLPYKSKLKEPLERALEAVEEAKNQERAWAWEKIREWTPEMEETSE
jgi:hypothetical protein